jgi:hypothetical protein
MDTIECIIPALFGNYDSLLGIYWCSPTTIGNTYSYFSGNYPYKEFNYKEDLQKKPPRFLKHDYLILLEDSFNIFRWGPSTGVLFSMRYSDIQNLQIENDQIIAGSVSDQIFRIKPYFVHTAYKALNNKVSPHLQNNDNIQETIIGGGLNNDFSLYKKGHFSPLSPSGFLVTNKGMYILDKDKYQADIWNSFAKGSLAGLFVFSAFTGPIAKRMKEEELQSEFTSPKTIEIMKKYSFPFVQNDALNEIHVNRNYGDRKRTNIKFLLHRDVFPDYGEKYIHFFHNSMAGAISFYGTILPLLKTITPKVRFFNIKTTK